MSKSNVFTDSQKFVNTKPRNTFDLSFQNNLTMQFGKIYPVLCKEVLPGDSFKIDSVIGCKFAPMVFPVQTRMNAYMHFFYVRNRNLWKDWPDFIGKTQDGLVPPYISQPEDSPFWKTRSLADYLNVPTTAVASKKETIEIIANDNFQLKDSAGRLVTISNANQKVSLINSTLNSSFLSSLRYGLVSGATEVKLFHINNSFFDSNLIFPVSSGGGNAIYVYKNDILVKIFIPGVNSNSTASTSCTFVEDFVPFINSLNPERNDIVIALTSSAQVYMKVNILSYDLIDITDKGGINPFNGSDGPIRISALPFRAYESIYRAYYQNQQNTPFIKDGKPCYNEYITTNEGGADFTNYELFMRNWESDAFTSALPSPQQGIAPLVGVSSNGEFTFQVTEDELASIGSGNPATFTVKTNIDEDGNITGISGYKTDGSTEGRVEDFLPGTLHRLNQVIMQGISINDFRNVNAFQRWLESNMRRGFRYKDQLLSHFGVDAKFEELDMPEFIGGYTSSVTVNSISQTAPGEKDEEGEFVNNLGSFAGQANLFNSGRTISHYCDEHGFIIGVLCVMPTPNYCQLLPKHFTKNHVLDYYFPEFGHIGYQPITLKELTPIQAYIQSGKSPNDVFGYQRPWYDYLASQDEVHGLMRTNMQNFLINRVFHNAPELGSDFLACDFRDLNNVFSVTDTSTDKIFGQVYFQITAKREIPRYGIPRLE